MNKKRLLTSKLFLILIMIIGQFLIMQNFIVAQENNTIEATSTRAVASGVVQFELIPTTHPGINATQARTALMNVQSVTHPLFSSATATSASTSVNGAFGRDALYLGETSTRFQIYIAGNVAWVNRNGATGTITLPVSGVNRTITYRISATYYPFGNYQAGRGRNAVEEARPVDVSNINLLENASQTIPYVENEENGLSRNVSATEVRSASYYVNRNGTLHRILTGNVTATLATAPWGHIVGPAPSWIPQNRAYYSYDGVFFYTNPRNIRTNGSGATNASNPHFNYFQYLSFRSRSNVTAAQMNSFLASQLTSTQRQQSVMTNSGQHFINAQNNFGTNALLQFAKAIHESGSGLSSIARSNNNIFGLNAVDSNPGGNASRFPNVQTSINEHANHWMSRGYLYPGDWRYAGPHVGHKGSGMNVRYATDPYWGEKIAGWAFRINQSAGNRDLNKQQIGVRRDTSRINVTNASGTTLYSINQSVAYRFFPVLITKNETNRRQILSDGAIVNNVVSRNGKYNHTNSRGFIASSVSLWITGASSPAAQPGTSTPAPAPQTRAGHTTTAVNLRAGAGTNHRVIRTLARNTNLTILKTSGSWHQVRVGTQTGWVSAQFVRNGNAPRANTNTSTLRGRTTASVNMRAGASTNQRIIRTLPRNTNFVILKRSGSWMQVRVGNQTGWVNAGLVQITAGPRRTTSAVNLRAGASTRNRVIRTIPRNTTVNVLKVSGSWSQVRIGNQTGWVSTQFLR